MRGGKVQPSDDNERQAEQENDDFAAPCHIGERSLTCLGASKKPKVTHKLFVCFQLVEERPWIGQRDILSAESSPQSINRLAKCMQRVGFFRLSQ
jgi:hypothetical protein